MMKCTKALLAVLAVACVPPGRANAGVIPLFNPATSSVSVTHDMGAGSGGGTPVVDNIPVRTSQGFSSPFNPSTIAFTGGNSVGKAGILHQETSTQLRLNFARGMGVSQKDPNHLKSSSTLEMNFSLAWDIIGGSFGPPATTNFSVPIGAKVGAGGSAKVTIVMRWATFIPGSPFDGSDFQNPFNATREYLTAGTYLEAVTAPTQIFSSNSFVDGSSIRLLGSIKFEVNNDLEESMIEFPTLTNFPELINFPELDFEPGASVEEVPEPGSISILLVGAMCVSLRRHRRRDI